MSPRCSATASDPALTSDLESRYYQIFTSGVFGHFMLQLEVNALEVIISSTTAYSRRNLDLGVLDSTGFP